MDSDIDSELKSDFTSYLEHISQRKKFQQNTTLTEHSYSSAEYQQDNLCSAIQTLFIHRFSQNENPNDDVDIETIDKDVKLLTYRPDVDSKSMESYRHSKLPKDPETWEDNINKQRWTKLERTLFERALSILYANRLSRLTYEGTVQEHVQKIIFTEKSVAEMHHLLTTYIHWDLSLSQWLHGLFISNLPDDYLAPYIDILEKLKLIAPSYVNEMISANSIGRSKEEIKLKSINLDEPIDPFNYMLVSYPPLKLPKNPVIILIPDYPGYCTQPNTRTYDWMNDLSYLAELDVALTAKVPWDYEEYPRKEELDISDSLEAMVDAGRSKILSVRSEDPSRPIILAGVGVSAAIACQVAVLEKVEGLVCIGFIVNSSEVKRGYDGDCILDLDCPTVFVTGQLSIYTPVLDMEEIRVKLKCKSNHILVGGSNDELLMNHSTKMREAVTQKLVDRCVLEEIGNFLKDTLEPSPKVIRKPNVENTDFKKPVSSKKKPNHKPLARLNKGNQKIMVSPNKPTSKRQLANRKTIKLPSSSLAIKLENIVKDEELMPPPPLTEQKDIFIPKLGNQKFSTLAELLQEQGNFNFNISQQNSSLTSMNGSSVMFTPDQNNIMISSSNFRSQQNQTAAHVMEEITPDQILDMPIVFADEPIIKQQEEEVKHLVSKDNYFITNLNELRVDINVHEEEIDGVRPCVVKEEILDDDDDDDERLWVVKEEILDNDNEEEDIYQVVVKEEILEDCEKLCIVKEECIDEDDAEDYDVLCSATMSRTRIPERLKIKQVAYDSPSKVKLVVNKAPTGLGSSGYQTFSVPSQNTGTIQFVNRLPISTNNLRRIDGGINPRGPPKTVSIRQIPNSHLKILKTSTGQPIQLNKVKTMATTQTFKKII